MALIEARGLALCLPDRSATPLFGAAPAVTIFRGVDLAIEAGESVGIVGESGSGKTSLARTLLRLYEPTAGSLHFKGRDITHLAEPELRPLRTQFQAIFQDPLSSLNPRHRVGTILSQPLLAYGRAGDRRSGRREACALLERVGLPAAFSERFPHELSGGQRQRVGVARALAADPDLLLLDEPFGALDAITRTNLQKEFAKLVRELGKTAVFVTHDLHEAMILGTRIALMDKGRIVLLDTPENFQRSDLPLVQAYLDTIMISAGY